MTRRASSILMILWIVGLFTDALFVEVAALPVSPSVLVAVPLVIVGMSVGFGRMTKVEQWITLGISSFVALAILSAYFSPRPLETLWWTGVLSFYAIIALAVRRLAQRRLLATEAVIWVSVVIVVSLGSYAILDGRFHAGNRLVFIIGQNPAYIGGQLAILCIGLAGVVSSRDSRHRIACAVLLTSAMLAMLVMTQGRNALFSLILAAVVALGWAWTRRLAERWRTHRNLWRRTSQLVLGMCVSAVVVFSFWQYVYASGDLRLDRIERTLRAQEDLSGATAGRTSIWAAYFSELPHTSLFPAGLRQARTAAAVEQAPHNAYLRVWIELSVLGFVMFCALHVLLWVKAVRARSIVLVALATFLAFYAMGNDVYYQREYWLGLALMAVLAFVPSRAKMERKLVGKSDTFQPSGSERLS